MEWKETRTRDWVNTIYFLVTPVLATVLVTLYIWLVGWSWLLALGTVFLVFFTNLTTTAGYHRYFSHKSHEVHPMVRKFYLWMGAFSVQGPVIHWASDHRRHHRYVDTDMDPYNINRGFFFAHMGWLFYKDEVSQQCAFAPDLAKDPACIWQMKNYKWLMTGMAFGLPTLMGLAVGMPLGGLIFWGLLRAVLCNHCTFFINSAAHMFGRQPFSDANTARDSLLTAVVANGEGYHNFHHTFQVDFRNGIRWYDWDPTKWWIQMLSFLGLATKLRTVPAADILKARLQMDEKRLLAKGVPQEQFAALKAKIQEAQRRVKVLREEYALMRRSAQEFSRKHHAQLRTELKAARNEFRLCLAQWGYYLRFARALPKPAVAVNRMGR